MEFLPPGIGQLVRLALDEDAGRGDVTSRLTVPPGHRSRGRVVAKSDLVLSGGDVFALALQAVDPALVVRRLAADGTRLAPGQVAVETEGDTFAQLVAERVALNFLQRLSGVATLTRRFVDALPAGCATRVTDTRKTTPGLRFLERRAVLHGGGHNHRLDLAGGILVKENHVVAAGGIARAVRLCREGAPHPLLVEVEVRDLGELDEALAAGAQAVLLDNFADDLVAEAVRRVAGRALVEVSGGITLDRVSTLARAGVDVVSVGALTHSAPAADLSFLLQAAP